MKMISVVKIGGKAIDDSVLLEKFLNDFVHLKGPKILIHGGGKKIDSLCKQLNIDPILAEGRRITDEKTLEVVILVLAGLINKTLVVKLQAKGINAAGISGIDGNLVRSVKRPVKNNMDYGMVGDVEAADISLIHSLLSTGFIPIVAPLSHDGHGQILNVNADTIASRIAISLSGMYDVQLLYCFDQNGVLKDMNNMDSVIDVIDSINYPELRSRGIVAAGMIPKIENAFDSIEAGVKKVHILNAGKLDQFISGKTGTTICRQR